MKPVEWVLAIFYGPSAHRATYGRLQGTKYTKDYIQLSRLPAFIADLSAVFGLPANGSVPVTYSWPGGSSLGELVALSADRPHLKWETREGAPPPWKMLSAPTPTTDQTIPGNPGLASDVLADAEYSNLVASGAGTPYLIAVKLKGEDNVLHLRAYLNGASPSFSWASVNYLPAPVRKLALSTSRTRALAAERFVSRGVFASQDVLNEIATALGSTGPATFDSVSPELLSEVLEYLKNPGEGVFFDPDERHDAWSVVGGVPGLDEGKRTLFVELVRQKIVSFSVDDIQAEAAQPDVVEVATLTAAALLGNYSVDDVHVTAKTRGSAQRVFSSAVKANYEYRCALTGIRSPQFLVASHIVPWSQDSSIRLDPANGICFSLLVDRAFEYGFILIEDDLTVRVDFNRIGEDLELVNYLKDFDGVRVRAPIGFSPKVEYLARRRKFVADK
ncbi:HNH endonuclease [Stenotrophomonas sp.]|uniref:HNH endonuclease n=1 Tax=Stenotrophomonas sp. TaxID=69392 RepID=UPI0028A64B2C|nr:HNH endonuclease [Stenotrophomonas sp.]